MRMLVLLALDFRGVPRRQPRLLKFE